jgi:glutathione synthase/RimK-type ligase-like ATP-grasp enzyme
VKCAPIVLAGAAVDEHVAGLADAVRLRGEEPIVLDSLTFPAAPCIALGETLDDIRLDDAPLARPGAVYLRGLYLSPLSYLVDAERDMADSWRTTLIVFKEKAEFLLSLIRRWEDLGVPVYNPLTASELTRKPHQLARLAAAGVPLPATLWTNDPRAAARFARGRRVAYKPVSGGAATRELRPQDLVPERLARLAHAPVTFQELLPGKDLRVFVLDGRVVAALRIEIEGDALDYRQNERAIESFRPDAALETIALDATRALGLRFAGIDLKGAADGSWRVLEVNASPMFIGFDQRAGTDVRGALAEALIEQARSVSRL